MKKRNAMVVGLVAAMALLATMGCWFCWHYHLFHRAIVAFRGPDMEFGEFGLTAKRGQILAADGSPLAYTERGWRFSLDPAVSKFHRIPPTKIGEVARDLGVPENVVAEALAREDSRYIFLKEVGEDDSAVAYFGRNRKWLTRCAGIICEPVQKRVYPLGEAATAVVGFMRGGVHADTPQGAVGLECAFDKILAGTNGVYDENLPLKDRKEKATPKPGADIQTTLVPEIQKASAEAIAAACETNGAESAFALVMKVPSGEISAMASWPTFDPSMRRNLGKWNPSMAVNRTAQVVFEPGALAKPIVEAVAKDAGELSKEKLHAGLLRFGFGAKTGTAGIHGEETGSFVGSPSRWDKMTEAGVGMGYGFAATGLQIAQAYATLANHGQLVKPRLVAKVVDGRPRDTIKEFMSETNEITHVVSPAAADAVARMLKSPVSSTVQMCERDRETGRGVYSQTNYIASCAGFVPADKPEYVVVVSFSKLNPTYTSEDVARSVFDVITKVCQ